MRELLLVGASVRAAAESAYASGIRVTAADLFGDVDLLNVATWVSIAGYPKGLAAVRERYAHLPVMYTGAIENHPDVVASMQRSGPLLGNTAETLRCVRDPVRLCESFAANGIHTARTCWSAPPAAERGRWLCKPVRSAGGFRIVRGETILSTAEPQDAYYQEWVEGRPIAASFVAADGKAKLLGVTNMLVGCPWLGANAFVYAGSILRLPDAAENAQWCRLGDMLAAECGVVGLFGVDAVLSDGRVVPVEVNPRYTASMEVLEHAYGIPMVAVHWAAVTSGKLPTCAVHPGRYVAKAIVYAKSPVRVAGTLRASHATSRLADIPRLGQSISPGHPVLSIRVTEKSAERLEERLCHEAAHLYDQLAEMNAGAGRLAQGNRGL